MAPQPPGTAGGKASPARRSRATVGHPAHARIRRLESGYHVLSEIGSHPLVAKDLESPMSRAPPADTPK